MYICLGANTMGYSFRSAFLSVLPGEARGMSVCSVTVNCRKAWIKPSAINRITYTKMLFFSLCICISANSICMHKSGKGTFGGISMF